MPNNTSPRGGGRERLLRSALVTVVFIALAAGGIWYATRPKPVAVTVAEVQPGRVEATVANTRAGSVTACRRAKLAPPLGGRIEQLHVHKGDRVKQGQVLLTLWNEDLAARERVSREQLASAQARVREVCELAGAAQREARRAVELREKGFVSQERVDKANAEADSRRAACNGARAQVAEARARIAASRADTSRTVLRAPFDGIVAEVNGEVGEYLTPSPPGIPTLPAVDLIDDSCLYVSAPIDEVDAAQIRVGMPARITLDAYRGKHFSGKVRRIAPYVLALEKQARTVEVEVQFDNPDNDRNLLVGYSADIEITVDARDNVPRIPTSALMQGNRVLVLDVDGRLQQRAVSIGLSNWEYAEITGGLQRGERVVTSLGREGVQPGVKAVVDSGPANP
jgi:HlyD family secretion protein